MLLERGSAGSLSNDERLGLRGKAEARNIREECNWAWMKLNITREPLHMFGTSGKGFIPEITGETRV